jgi:hydroxymethylpyrimidine kinase/phosphomethylpyrimidine kinase
MKVSSEARLRPVALTIAGLDPSGGAGIIADVRTFEALGCRATAAITSVTFQNAGGVFGASHQPAEAVRRQVIPIIENFDVNCVKTGMLPTSEIVREVARLFRETHLPAPVVDPVMRSSSGYDLTDDEAIAVLISDLLPLARVLTPNIPEAERITGFSIKDEAGMLSAARTIREQGARAVLIKGGHLRPRFDQKRQESRMKGDGEESDSEPEEAIDVLDNEGKVTVFRKEFVAGAELHGSGCILSAAIAASVGKGMDLEDAVCEAKAFVTQAIRNSLHDQ